MVNVYQKKLLIHIAVKSLSFHPVTNTYCKHGFMSCVINGFAWKYYGLTVLCEQCKNIERFCVNKVSGQIFQLSLKIQAVLCECRSLN